MTEQAQETPEPLTPAMHEALVMVFGECDHDKPGVPDCTTMCAALRAVTPDPAKPCRHNAKWLSEYTSWVIRAYEHRRATPDPAEPLRLDPMCRGNTPDGPCDDEMCEGHGATPDPAEPGLREALRAACDAWTDEHGPAGYAAHPPAWFRQARAALADPAEPGLRGRLIEAVDMALRYSPDPKHSQPYLEGAIQRAYADAALARSEEPT